MSAHRRDKLLWKIKLVKKIVAFGNTEIENQKFASCNNPISIYEVNIDRIEVSDEIPFGKKSFKYFIMNKNDYENICALGCNVSKNECT